MQLKAKDTFRCEVLRPLGQDHLYALMSLYQPLVGCDGVSLYLTLYSEAKHQRSYESHSRLCRTMNMDITVLEQARHRLEEMMLLRCYRREKEEKNNYVYVLYQPLSADQFFKHEVLSRLYCRRMGNSNYQMSLNKLSHLEVSRDGFEEITQTLKSSVIENWDEQSEEQFSQIRPRYQFDDRQHPSIRFDYDRFLSRASNLVFPIEARTSDNLRLIGELATMYGYSADEMLVMVGRSTNNADNSLDVQKLRSLAFVQKPKAPSKAAGPYDLPPVAFLQSLQHGVAVTDNDKRIIEMLVSELKMPPQVVNVLLEYVLKISDNRLVRSFVESVAAAWMRNGVDSVDKAIAETKKPRRPRAAVQRRDVLPDYYQQSSQAASQEVTEDFNREEFEEIRRQLREREG